MWPKKRRKQDKSSDDSLTHTDSPVGSESRSTTAADGTRLKARAQWPHRRGRKKSPADVSESDDEQSQDPENEPPVTFAMVRERAVRLLARREHGKKELQQKLLQRELPEDLVISVVDKLAEEGLQCDARFAESYTRMRVARGYGANKVRADLQTRRLDQSVIEEAVRSREVHWGSVALAALEKKFSTVIATDQKSIAKMQRYLYQRGFDMADIKAAITELSPAKL